MVIVGGVGEEGGEGIDVGPEVGKIGGDREFRGDVSGPTDKEE